MIASKSKRGQYFKLSQKNIYIFPSAAGFAYLALLLVMLITAINYQNSLIYLVTFFLGALFFFSIWVCFLNLSGLDVSSGADQSAFEGEKSYFLVKFRKEEGDVFGLKVGLSTESMAFLSSVSSELVEHPILSTRLKRGKHTIRRLRLESTFPFGLIKAWTWLKLDANAYIYPKPVKGSPTHADTSSDSGVKSYKKSDEYSDLRPYQQGDPVNRINWKKYAATESLVVRDADLTASDARRVRWQDYEPHGKEFRLQFMCEKICSLYQAKKAFGMELPSICIEPDYSEAHFHECLKQLAMY